jgi:hypothetical protein
MDTAQPVRGSKQASPGPRLGFRWQIQATFEAAKRPPDEVSADEGSYFTRDAQIGNGLRGMVAVMEFFRGLGAVLPNVQRSTPKAWICNVQGG